MTASLLHLRQAPGAAVGGGGEEKYRHNKSEKYLLINCPVHNFISDYYPNK
jgi:hypothetical protein